MQPLAALPPLGFIREGLGQSLVLAPREGDEPQVHWFRPRP